MAYSIPTESERPVLFRWLQQQSSYTVWSKIDRYYAAWTGEFERIAPLALDPKNSEPYLNESEARLMFGCRAAFVEALARLRRGDRTVFKWLGYGSGQGYFCEAYRVVESWRTARNRSREGFPIAETEYWADFEMHFEALIAAWGNGIEALQERHLDLPAPIKSMSWLRGDVQPQAYPAYRGLRDSGIKFPPVPAPSQEVMISTGKDIPYYGIWEPVKLDMSSGFIGLFKKPSMPPDGQFEPDGCMNYLHAGSPAPTIGFEQDGPRGEGRPTIWRLLWQDERYLDGKVPEEEREYIFVDPPSVRESKPVASFEVADLIVAKSGSSAMVGGAWAAREFLGVRVGVRAGEDLPQYMGRDIDWVFVGAE